MFHVKQLNLSHSLARSLVCLLLMTPTDMMLGMPVAPAFDEAIPGR